jgi:hypothetical protein
MQFQSYLLKPIWDSGFLPDNWFILVGEAYHWKKFHQHFLSIIVLVKSNRWEPIAPMITVITIYKRRVIIQFYLLMII